MKRCGQQWLGLLWGRKRIEKEIPAHPATLAGPAPGPRFPKQPGTHGQLFQAKALGSRRGSRTLAVSTLIHPLPGGPPGPLPGAGLRAACGESAGTVLVVMDREAWRAVIHGVALELLRGSQAPRRAVCGTRRFLRTMHGGGPALTWALAGL